MNPLYQDELSSATARNPAPSGAASVGVNGPPVQDRRREAISKMGAGEKFLTALGEFGAGLQGRSSPLDARIRGQQEERMMKLQEFKIHSEALDDGVKMAGKLKGPARKQFIDQYSQQLEDVRPGLGKAYQALSDTPGVGEALFKYAQEIPELKVALEADPSGDAALKLLQSPQFMEKLSVRLDQKAMPLLFKKGQTFLMGWQQIVPKEMVDKFKKDGRIGASELLEANEWVKANKPEMKAMVLTDEDLQVIGRNSDAYFNSLGIDSPKDEADIRKKQSTDHESSTQYERSFDRLKKLQLKVNAGETLTPEEQLDAENDRALLSQQRMQIDPVTNQPMFSQPITIPSSITVGAGKGSGKAVNTVPPIEDGRKPLDAGTEKEVAKMGDGIAQLHALQGAIKPEFAGFASDTLANGAIEAGRRGILSRYKDMAEFWQGYEQWVSAVRAADYGLTLTPQELVQFNKFRSKPSDAFAVIEENMKRQAEIVEGAIQRRLGAIQKSGQNVKQAEELVGPKAKGVDREKKPPEEKKLELDARPDPNDYDAGDVMNGPEGSFTLQIIDGKKKWVK